MLALLASRGESADVRVGSAQIFMRIDRSIVDAHFVVEVWSGAAAGIANIADGIAAMNAFSGEDRNALHMSIACSDAMAMVENYSASISAHESGKRHGGVRGGHDRLPNGRSNVNAGMECAFTVKRIDTFAKSCRNRAFHRPQIRSRVSANPISRGHVAREPKRQASGCRTAQRGRSQCGEAI